MKPLRFVRLAALAAIALPLARLVDAQNTPPLPVVAFVDVNVIPMDRERVLEGQTVIVRDGRIASIEPSARARIPSGAVRVDGRGKYLMPGLAEMHAHIPGAQAPEQVIRDIFTLYVANGVTTIRGMLGAPNQLTLRAKTASGEMLGPTIYVGAPSLNGNSASDPATAARLVREHKAAGYDFLKLHPGIPRTSYDSIVAAARAVGITYAGHISQAVGLEHTLASRQSTIDHLDGYLEAAVPEAVRMRVMADQAAVRQDRRKRRPVQHARQLPTEEAIVSESAVRPEQVDVELVRNPGLGDRGHFTGLAVGEPHKGDLIGRLRKAL